MQETHFGLINLIRLRGGFHYSNKAFAIKVTKPYQFGLRRFYSTSRFVVLSQPNHYVCRLSTAFG